MQIEPRSNEVLLDWGVLPPVSQVPKKRRGAETHGGEGHTEGHQGVPAAPGCREVAVRPSDPALNFRREQTPPTPCFWAPGLQTGRQYASAAQSPQLWHSVESALGL